MKKLFILLVVCFVLVGCGKVEITQSDLDIAYKDSKKYFKQKIEKVCREYKVECELEFDDKVTSMDEENNPDYPFELTFEVKVDDFVDFSASEAFDFADEITNLGYYESVKGMRIDGVGTVYSDGSTYTTERESKNGKLYNYLMSGGESVYTEIDGKEVYNIFH